MIDEVERLLNQDRVNHNLRHIKNQLFTESKSILKGSQAEAAPIWETDDSPGYKSLNHFPQVVFSWPSPAETSLTPEST
jgi:hypothetical protein